MFFKFTTFKIVDFIPLNFQNIANSQGCIYSYNK